VTEERKIRLSIETILNQTHTIAVVGFSTDALKAGNYVPEYLQKQGYRILPVNPNIQEGLGEKAYPDLLSIPIPVDVVLIFRRSEAVPPIVEDAIKIGAKTVWMQPGIINQEASDRAQAAGLEVVTEHCMMVEHRKIV
jgi:predicted CoA-binding protein